MTDLHSAMQSDLGEISSAQKSLERSLSTFTVDLVKKFDDLTQLQNNLNSIRTAAGVPLGGGGAGGMVDPESGGGGGGGGSIERSASRTRITEEVQRRTMLKKSGSSGKSLGG
jgi:hypothetical protein